MPCVEYYLLLILICLVKSGISLNLRIELGYRFITWLSFKIDYINWWSPGGAGGRDGGNSGGEGERIGGEGVTYGEEGLREERKMGLFFFLRNNKFRGQFNNDMWQERRERKERRERMKIKLI